MKVFIHQYPKSSLPLMSEELDLPNEPIRRILINEMKMRKICSVWVPHLLSARKKEDRISCVQTFSAFSVVTVTSLAFLQCKMKPGRRLHKIFQSSKTRHGWHLFNSIQERTVKEGLTDKKTMLLFTITEDKVYMTATLRGQTVDAEFYVKFVRQQVGEHWRKFRTHPACLEQLLHDNARPHTAALTQAFFRNHFCSVRLVGQSPYRPDLNMVL